MEVLDSKPAFRLGRFEIVEGMSGAHLRATHGLTSATIVGGAACRPNASGSRLQNPFCGATQPLARAASTIGRITPRGIVTQ